MDATFDTPGAAGAPAIRRTPAFRAATPDDVPALVHLVDSAYRGTAGQAGWTHESEVFHGPRTDPESVAGIVADPDRLLLVAEEEGEPVACCQLEFRPGYVYFGLFAVRPDRQAGGLGKAVLAEAERRARATAGVGQMRMTVLTIREELIAYYLRRGYRRTGELTAFPYGEVRYGVPQFPDLEFELLVKDLA